MNARAIWLAAGATVDDAIGEMKVYDDTVKATVHFRLSGQLIILYELLA